jgi:carbon storage regulator
MLVLTRRVGEEIVIDGRIRIVVVEVNWNRVRLGICAPPSVNVDRKEVHERRLVSDCRTTSEKESQQSKLQDQWTASKL